MATFQAKDIDGNVLLEASGDAAGNQYWVGMDYAGVRVVSVEDATPPSEPVIPTETERMLTTLETEITNLTARIEALENP